MNNSESPLVHEHAIVEPGSHIGNRSKIWAFAHVLPGARIGDDCNICDGVFIEGSVTVGNRVTVKCGVQLWNGVTLEDDVFVGPNATFTNDIFPRSRQWKSESLQTVVHKGASIGANATILPGISIGQYAMVGAGSVVTKSVPAFAKVVGNPARIIGYVDTPNVPPSIFVNTTSLENTENNSVRVKGVTIHKLPRHSDIRGDLTVGIFGTDIPFIPARYFTVFSVPSSEVRGEHAHYKCKQFLVCIHGSLILLADDGLRKKEYVMNNPEIGVYLPPLIWGTQFNYSMDAVLLVFASLAYDSADYIRNYNDFIKTVKSSPK